MGPECVKTLRQNQSVRAYVKSEIYRHVSRCEFRVEARFSVRFLSSWLAQKRFYTPSVVFCLSRLAENDPMRTN